MPCKLLDCGWSKLIVPNGCHELSAVAYSKAKYASGFKTPARDNFNSSDWGTEEALIPESLFCKVKPEYSKWGESAKISGAVELASGVSLTGVVVEIISSGVEVGGASWVSPLSREISVEVGVVVAPVSFKTSAVVEASAGSVKTVSRVWAKIVLVELLSGGSKSKLLPVLVVLLLTDGKLKLLSVLVALKFSGGAPVTLGVVEVAAEVVLEALLPTNKEAELSLLKSCVCPEALTSIVRALSGAFQLSPGMSASETMVALEGEKFW